MNQFKCDKIDTLRRVFFHIHLWKTAGTTFLNICRDNFGKAFQRDIMLIQNWSLSKDQLHWLLNYHPWLRCYSCHMLSGDLPYDSGVAEVLGIAFVRDPVDRFVSSYTFQQNPNYRGGFAHETSFDDFCLQALDKEDNPLWRNGQTYVLGNGRTEEALGRITQRVKQGRLALFPAERFNESCMALERGFPHDFGDCSYAGAANVSPKKETVTEAQRQSISRYMDLDNRLLELAHESLDASLHSLFPDSSECKDFNSDFAARCAKKRKRQRKLYVLNRFEAHLSSMVKKCLRI